jgi:monoamine oxidase
MEATPPVSDCAADALEPEGEWNAYVQAISGFMNGAGLEHVSVVDYTAYDAAATGYNWRTSAGYGTLIAASLPHPIDLRLSTPVQSIELDGRGVELTTPVGAVRARAAILTVSTAVLAGSTIRLPPGLDAWRHAAACLPLGRDEKFFIEIVGKSSFAPARDRESSRPPHRCLPHPPIRLACD